ncbi:MAG: BON domain-containing protein, partial [Bryobacteraceae bacterium]|nr:BON domain-containing protein [Bryobacteraceae bacterium]
SAIELDMRTRLARSKLSTEGIQISVRNGVATLTGRTSVVQRKGTATRMAKSSGATAVVNKIEISEAGKKVAMERMAEGREAGKRPALARQSAPAAETPIARVPNTASPATPATTPGPPPIRRAQVKH